MEIQKIDHHRMMEIVPEPGSSSAQAFQLRLERFQLLVDLTVRLNCFS